MKFHFSILLPQNSSDPTLTKFPEHKNITSNHASQNRSASYSWLPWSVFPDYFLFIDPLLAWRNPVYKLIEKNSSLSPPPGSKYRNIIAITISTVLSTQKTYKHLASSSKTFFFFYLSSIISNYYYFTVRMSALPYHFWGRFCMSRLLGPWVQFSRDVAYFEIDI